MKRFVVVTTQPDGTTELHPMKEWLRQHPDSVPPGLDPTNSTSHQLRGGLKRRGWTALETEDEVRMVPPGSHVPTPPLEDDEPVEQPGPGFTLESQLRDFLAENIEQLKLPGKRLQLYVDPIGQEANTQDLDAR